MKILRREDLRRTPPPAAPQGDAPLGHEELRDILRANFELFKDEPEFFDYLTTLVVYLMRYEYEALTGQAGRFAVDTPPLPTPARQRLRPQPTGNNELECPHCRTRVKPGLSLCPMCLGLLSA